MVPWRLHFQNLRVACFHCHLRKVRVGLKVYRKTELFRDKIKDKPFWENVQIFYLADIEAELRFELVNTRQRNRFGLSTTIKILLQGRQICPPQKNRHLQPFLEVGSHYRLFGRSSASIICKLYFEIACFLVYRRPS